ncbi:MAG: DNA-binding protein [Bacteroidetes bacterium]|jgi:transcriptional regulator with XRE-family HTH domain|nr:DNA-binding protein [Bacteroidota bacterium]
MNLSSNLKLLRKRKGLTQDEAAEQMGISRTKVNAYENEHSEPTIDSLIMLATFYGINVDTLIKTDLSRLSEKQLEEVENGYDSYISGSKLRVLTSTVDNDDNENIELVPAKAKAGYTEGYNDPDFISKLPTFQLPFLSKERKYRTFQLDGDSMYPIKDKSYVIGEFVQNWIDIKDGNAYVILTSDDGIVFKVVFNNIKKDKTLLMHSLNPLYKDYEIKINQVKEIWKFVSYFSHELPDVNNNRSELLTAIKDLEEKINELKVTL